MTCETVVHWRLNMSCIIAEDICIRHELDSVEKTESLQYIDEFYETIKPFKTHVTDAKITALSTLYSGLIRAVISGYDYSHVLVYFVKIRCFILQSKDYSFENGLYLRSVALSFRRAIVTAPVLSLSYVETMKIYIQSLEDINVRFRCVETIKSAYLK